MRRHEPDQRFDDGISWGNAPVMASILTMPNRMIRPTNAVKIGTSPQLSPIVLSELSCRQLLAAPIWENLSPWCNRVLEQGW